MGVGGNVCVGYFELVISLCSNGSESSGGGVFLDEEKVEECDKQDESSEQVEHESQGKVQALSFCQRLIQLWLRSRLKQQSLAKQGNLEGEKRVVILGSIDQLKAGDLDVCT